MLVFLEDAQIASATDYCPFGWEMPGRNINSDKYRYGFNGKEKDDDGEFGSITNYDYGFRIYNPAVGRFLSVDPLTRNYPYYTPYQFAANSPIGSIDLDGLESLFKHQPEIEYKPVFKNGPNSVMETLSNAGHNFMAIPSNAYKGAENNLRSIWNFGVNLYHGKYNGSNATVILVKMDHAFSEGIDRNFDYHTTTPLTNQLIDALDRATDPKSIEFSLELYLFGGKQILDDLAKKTSTGLTINTGSGTPPLPLPVPQRVKKLFKNLDDAKPAGSADEALDLINKTLDKIEDAYSGIVKNPNADKMPNIQDGRMYGVLDDKFVKRNADGSLRAFTRKNVIVAEGDGSFKIFVRDKANKVNDQKGKLLFEKKGKTE